MKHKKPYKLVPKIISDGVFAPTGHRYTSKKSREAHKEADRRELKKYGKRKFEALEKLAKSIPKNELLAKVDEDGNTLMSQRVPPKYRDQVKFHEDNELAIMVGPQNERLCLTKGQLYNIVDAAEGRRGACPKAKEFIKELKKELK